MSDQIDEYSQAVDTDTTQTYPPAQPVVVTNETPAYQPYTATVVEQIPAVSTSIVYSRGHVFGGLCSTIIAMILNIIALTCSSNGLAGSNNLDAGWYMFTFKDTTNTVHADKLRNLDILYANCGLTFAAFLAASILSMVVAIGFHFYAHHSFNRMNALTAMRTVFMFALVANVFSLIAVSVYSAGAFKYMKKTKATGITPLYGLIISYVATIVFLPMSIVFSHFHGIRSKYATY